MLRTASAVVLLSLSSLWLSTASAAPIISGHFNSDAAFLTHLSGMGIELPADELFVAQVRSGNNAFNGDYELGLHVPPNFTNAGPVAGGSTQLKWGLDNTDNAWFDFTLSRLGTTVSFDIAGYSGAWTDASIASLNTLGFRVRSQTGVSSTRVADLSLNNVALGAGTDLTALNGGLDFLVISQLQGNFDLSGRVQLNWDTANGAIPSGSRLGFQIKGLHQESVAVPEPLSTTLLLSGLLLMLAQRRRPTAATARITTRG